MRTIERPDLPTFSALNLDGSSYYEQDEDDDADCVVCYCVSEVRHIQPNESFMVLPFPLLVPIVIIISQPCSRLNGLHVDTSSLTLLINR